MSLLLLFPGVSTPQSTIPPPPPTPVVAAVGGAGIFAPPRRLQRRRVVADVIRVPNYNEIIQLEDEEWVILLQ